MPSRCVWHDITVVRNRFCNISNKLEFKCINNITFLFCPPHISRTNNTDPTQPNSMAIRSWCLSWQYELFLTKQLMQINSAYMHSTMKLEQRMHSKHVQTSVVISWTNRFNINRSHTLCKKQIFPPCELSGIYGMINWKSWSTTSVAFSNILENHLELKYFHPSGSRGMAWLWWATPHSCST